MGEDIISVVSEQAAGVWQRASFSCNKKTCEVGIGKSGGLSESIRLVKAGAWCDVNQQSCVEMRRVHSFKLRAYQTSHFVIRPFSGSRRPHVLCR